MKVVFLYPLNRDAYNYLLEEMPKDVNIIAKIRGEDEITTTPNKDPLIIDETKTAEILMGPYVTEEILEGAIPENGGKLKLIFIPWTGVDRLDFELLRKYPVQVANSHGNARTVAEHAIALMLTASKNIIHHDRLLREGDWSSRFNKMSSLLIKGKTIGLLGFGAIGTECAKLLHGFNVNIIACRNNPKKSTKEQRKITKDIYSVKELGKFLKRADIIINSLPLTNETKGILGKEEFIQMKEQVVIVNVGRGPTIDEEAIYEAIKAGKVFAAGLDPQWNYPPRGSSGVREHTQKTYPSKYPLHDFDQVVLSPHRAADLSQGYERAHWDDVIENLKRIYEGQKPLNLINLEKEY